MTIYKSRVMMSLPAADGSAFFLMRWVKLGRQCMVRRRVGGRASAEVHDERRRCRSATGCRSPANRPARVHAETGTPARRACTLFAAAHEADGKVAGGVVWGRLKMQDWKMTDHRKAGGWKMQDWNLADQIAGLENAGLEFGGPNSRAGNCRTGKCRTGKCRTKRFRF